MELNKYLKIVMIKRNITMNDLAEKININYKTLSGKFSRNSFGDITLIKICKFLKIEIADLYNIITKNDV